jgi:hypothetical protein
MHPRSALLVLGALLLATAPAAAPAQAQHAPQPVQLSAQAGSLRRDEFGADVAVVGDLDGDGFDEWMAGKSGPPFGGMPQLRVYSGGSGALLYEIDGPGMINGLFLESLADLGDVDGDGVTDFAFAVANASMASSPNVGNVVVYSGATGLELYTRWGLRSFGGFGASLAVLGDVTGDAVPDFVVGAIGSLDENAWVVSGANGAIFRRVPGPRGLGDIEFGWSAAALGDVDGDGRPDFAIGTRSGGLVSAYSSTSGALLFRAHGGSSFGIRLAPIGDVDRDGQADLLVGEPEVNAVHIVSGRDGTRLTTVHAPDGSNFGDALAAAGDVDRDRIPDFLVGDDGYRHGSGRVRLYSARNGRLLFEVVGARPGERLGASVAGGAHFDANEWPDLVVGAPGALRPERGVGEVTTWSGWRAGAQAHGQPPQR